MFDSLRTKTKHEITDLHLHVSRRYFESNYLRFNSTFIGQIKEKVWQVVGFSAFQQVIQSLNESHNPLCQIFEHDQSEIILNLFRLVIRFQ